MKTYIVTWSIDIDAESPIEAAEQALQIQRDCDSFATEFEVKDVSLNESYIVDAYFDKLKCENE